jgi:replicative DNA helicase
VSSKYVDPTSIIQVIGCVFNNPQLLDFTDKYTITDEDFPDEFHRTVFGAIYKIHGLGAQHIGLENIADFFSGRPKSAAIYKANEGEKWLLNVSDKANPLSFDYYYARLKKMSLLRAYDSYGIDVTDIYDPDNILDAKKKQLQEDILDNSSLEEIAAKVDQKIDDIKLRFVDESFGEAQQAGEGVSALIDKFKQTPEVGVPLYGPLINTVTRGARLKKFYLRSAATGVGKCLPNSTIIPTPEGYTTVGQVKVGDYLFDAFGKPTKVLAIYPQGEKEVWEVTFKDGRKALCCEDHLWSYCTEEQKKEAKEGRKFYTDTLKDLSKKELYQKGHGYKILVPMQKAVQYPEKQYPIDPYVLGLFLGDGSFRYQNNNKTLMFSSSDEELVDYINTTMNWNSKQFQNHSQYSWYFEFKDNLKEHKNVWVEDFLKSYPELLNVCSEDKFIPLEYMQGSIEQRFEVLNGLLDTDGSVDKEKGRISYYTISSRLRDNVIELARSLGFKTSVIEDSHKDTNICYKIEISGQPEDKIKLFKLNRKKELILQWYNNGKRKENNLFNPIIEIKKLDYSEEMTCFYVDNEEHLFLMNDFIVTHNTRSMIADCCYIGCNQIYDESFGWIKTGAAQPCLYITTEQELEEIQTMMLAFLSNVQEDHILNGKYEGDEEDRVREAAKILINSPIYVEEMPDFSLQDVENTIKKGIRDHDVKYVFNPIKRVLGQ